MTIEQLSELSAIHDRHYNQGTFSNFLLGWLKSSVKYSGTEIDGKLMIPAERIMEGIQQSLEQAKYQKRLDNQMNELDELGPRYHTV